MGWIFIKYDEVITGSRTQQGETIGNRVHVIPRIHSKEVQEILWSFSHLVLVGYF